MFIQGLDIRAYTLLSEPISSVQKMERYTLVTE